MTLKASEEFAVGKHNIGYLDSDFTDRFGDKTFSSKEIGKFQKLGRYMEDAAGIEKSLNPGKCELGDVLAFLNNPPEGTKDGYCNLFLVGEYVVSAFWLSSYGGWNVYCWLRDMVWSDELRVFSPGRDLETVGAKSSDSLTLGLEQAIKVVKEAGYKIFKEV